MPSSIYNIVTVSSDSVEMINHLARFLEQYGGGIFTAFIQPESQTDAARIEAWGTTTEIFAQGCGGEDCVTIDEATDTTVQFSFVTDGSPPRKVLEQLTRMGFAVKCHYQSLRICYGTWEQGHDQYSFQSLLYPQRTGRQQAALQVTDDESDRLSHVHSEN